MPQIVIASPETFSENCVLTIDYLIGDAVEAILAKRPQIDSEIAMAIHKAIQRMSRRLSSRLWIDPERHRPKSAPITGNYPAPDNIFSWCLKGDDRSCTQPSGMFITIQFVFLIGTNIIFFTISVAKASAAPATADATARASNDEGAIIKSASSYGAGNPI
ncbi:hypothetical protein CGMCC3_g10008 [Colletotrichum fructicola]|uniref:Uncharacterized protein n=1 Tax=Colletotrichum fructicola (strain Nara gc5) TaxID=1213859 RepID=A0A7J6J109_COLFN|nr:uncharacterized protein CGMCC3_g10008 [Colletotrichum fructicola]KAE9573993.1 hypothetical protein CGMCC3_g10008 [Colletotrichum fructicola]KAF4430826.1 hypothetical protein CFRS1_v009477 [Colletotrichum fructicola]KAF4482020.1 hypothetical protein CGGC5_v009933 [Colletotrichum fructicola Nara gc5]